MGYDYSLSLLILLTSSDSKSITDLAETVEGPRSRDSCNCYYQKLVAQACSLTETSCRFGSRMPVRRKRKLDWRRACQPRARLCNRIAAQPGPTSAGCAPFATRPSPRCRSTCSRGDTSSRCASLSRRAAWCRRHPARRSFLAATAARRVSEIRRW